MLTEESLHFQTIRPTQCEPNRSALPNVNNVSRLRLRASCEDSLIDADAQVE